MHLENQFFFLSESIFHIGLAWWLSSKEFTCHCRRHRFDSWGRRSPGEGNGNPLQNSCLGNSMDRGAWQATVHRIPSVRHDFVTKTPTIGILGRHKHSAHSNALKFVNCKLQFTSKHWKIAWSSDSCFVLFCFKYMMIYSLTVKSFCDSGNRTLERDGREWPGHRTPGTVHGKVVVILVYEVHWGEEGVSRQEWDMIPWSGSRS